MKVFGSPGTWSGLVLRVFPALFGIASGFMIELIYDGYAITVYTKVYRFLMVEMFLQSAYSVIHVWFHVHRLVANTDVYTPLHAFIFLAFDAITMLSSAAMSFASVGVTVFLVKDTGLCSSIPDMSCGRFQLAVLFGFFASFFQAASAFSNFRLLPAIVSHVE